MIQFRLGSVQNTVTGVFYCFEPLVYTVHAFRDQLVMCLFNYDIQGMDDKL